ncbi:transcriptional regulator, ArsR family [Roseibacterium elongatum DSM 19469]|uniref:Transcriptional regulator, ArsR family n=1 Tax=Roseicyclus elongatus DSM 19469 TaxID=1294273 RepID=W8SRB7_9RHOB|nr:metalloregulator ArsR/SmtB family transcription factor [Roseibacterium elongatum]AHM05070.1 transcriptional regulator, ArsR family [Roseibacterium elongatum DSM 19469]
MEDHDAIDALSALAQTSRLSVFRLLVQAGPEGLPALEIARRLHIVPSTLSGHLAILKRAGILTATRRQREIHYKADLACMNALMEFLLSDCCNGQIDDCRGALPSFWPKAAAEADPSPDG